MANFAWEATPGSMAGLVPENSTTSNGSTEVRTDPVKILDPFLIFSAAMLSVGISPAGFKQSNRQLPQS